MKIIVQRIMKIVLETLGLSSARGRLIFFVLISLCVFVLPPKLPVSFSVWQRMGEPAPSIGLTRAYRLVLHGDLSAAWQQNKLIYVVIVVGGAILIKDVMNLAGAKHAKVST